MKIHLDLQAGRPLPSRVGGPGSVKMVERGHMQKRVWASEEK
jgi:hypothetical protein